MSDKDAFEDPTTLMDDDPPSPNPLGVKLGSDPLAPPPAAIAFPSNSNAMLLISLLEFQKRAQGKIVALASTLSGLIAN